MKTIREHNGITWMVAEPAGILSGDGRGKLEGAVLVVPADPEFASHFQSDLRFKGVFGIGEKSADFFDAIKKRTGLFVMATDMEEAVRLVSFYATRGDKVLFVADSSREIEEILHNY